MEVASHNKPQMPLVKNQIIYDRLTSNSFRILYTPDKENELGYWIQMNSQTNIPKSFQVSDVQEKLAMDTLTVVADTETVVLPDNELSPAAIRRRDKAWSLIHHIVTLEPEIYTLSGRSKLLQNVEIASGTKVNNLYSYLGKYWRNGCQINALAANYQNCGGVREMHNGKNIGKPKRPGNNGKILTEKDYECFEYAIQHFYQNGNGESLHKTYSDMLAMFYIQPRISKDQPPVSLSADEKPSFYQFYYWYHKNCNIVETTKAREGESNFNLKHRAVTGQTKTDLFGPGHSFQIDATIGDFYLTMGEDSARVIGRPIIVLLIDAWSDMVTGVSITLHNSSCDVWKEALLNAITPKADFCRRYGVEINEEDWPCHILPVSITTDNGEFAVRQVDEIVRTLGITVENCPPYRGDLKGLVERAIGTHQLALKPWVPGYVDKDAGERGAHDYRKDSCVDFNSFVEVFLRIILFHNNHHYMKGYTRTEDLRKHAVPSIPRELWNYGISHMTGALRVASQDQYLDVLLHQGMATVTESGIRHEELYYTCPEIEEGKWMERARIGGPYDIPIRYSISSCAHIYIKQPDGKYITCSLVGAYQQYQNRSLEEANASHEQDLDLQASYSQQEDQAYAELKGHVDAIIGRCKEEKQTGTKIKETLRKHSIDENREEEKSNLNGENEARKMQSDLGIGSKSDSTPAGSANDKPKSFSSVSDDIDAMLATLNEQS